LELLEDGENESFEEEVDFNLIGVLKKSAIAAPNLFLGCSDHLFAIPSD
jgi:hypothetical protein